MSDTKKETKTTPIGEVPTEVKEEV
jgi:hypothetical protein